MKDPKPFEIPEALRTATQQNLDQARVAYDRFMDAARQAHEVVTKSSAAMTSGAREVQERALKFTQENMDANFQFARDLARCKDLKEAMELQARFAREQMENYSFQAQELGLLVSKAATKARPK
jgi:phasin